MDTLLRLVEANETAFWTLVDLKGMRAEFVRTTVQPTKHLEASYSLRSSAAGEGATAQYQPKEFRRLKPPGATGTF